MKAYKANNSFTQVKKLKTNYIFNSEIYKQFQVAFHLIYNYSSIAHSYAHDTTAPPPPPPPIANCHGIKYLQD